MGIDHETAAFAVNTLRSWWITTGRRAYPTARRLLITADSGGANGNCHRAWKVELAALAAETGLQISVCHLPPGTGEWNKIEHRLLSRISNKQMKDLPISRDAWHGEWKHPAPATRHARAMLS